MIRAGIVGGTGYTGVELLRILILHPEVEVTAVTSRADAGQRVDKTYPSLRGLCDTVFSQPEVDNLADCDVVFFATPNGTAMNMAADLLARGVKVIDLSADFRIKDIDEWEKWYGMSHASPELVAEAVYGLPEGHLIADAKSGVSGAGRKAEVSSLMSEAGESFKAYAVPGHRHLPEIKQGLQLATEQAIGLTFVPHLTPMIRGIHATLYARLTSNVDLQSLFEQRYQNEYFVDAPMPTPATCAAVTAAR